MVVIGIGVVFAAVLAIPVDADQAFQADADRMIMIVGRAIAIPGTLIGTIPERFPQGQVALDITRGKLFLRFGLQKRQGADQEIVHAENQGIAPPSFRTGVGTTGYCPRLLHQPRS